MLINLYELGCLCYCSISIQPQPSRGLWPSRWYRNQWLRPDHHPALMWYAKSQLLLNSTVYPSGRSTGKHSHMELSLVFFSTFDPINIMPHSVMQHNDPSLLWKQQQAIWGQPLAGVLLEGAAKKGICQGWPSLLGAQGARRRKPPKSARRKAPLKFPRSQNSEGVTVVKWIVWCLQQKSFCPVGHWFYSCIELPIFLSCTDLQRE